MTQIQRVDAVIWDLDGALVDTKPDLRESFKAAAKAVGYGELTEDQLRDKIGGGARKAFEKIFGEADAQYVDPAVEYFSEYYPNHAAIKSVVYPGILETLEAMHGQVKLAVATAKIRSATLAILDGFDLAKYFDLVITADDMIRMKPDPECIEIVQEKFAAEPARVVMIGDMKTDVMAAHAAGSLGIGVSYGYGKAEDIASVNPELLVDDPREILDYLSRDD